MKRILRLGDGYALIKHKPNDFNIRYISLMATALFMCLTAAQQVSAQEAEPADAVMEFTPLRIGDTIPTELWNTQINRWTASAGTQKINLHRFKGKWILLDFWNTYCGSCIDGFPRMNGLQEDYARSLEILNVTKEAPERLDMVKGRPKLKGILTQSLVDDVVLHAAFPHRTVPHLVLINPQGMVVAFPKSHGFTADYIEGWIASACDPDTGKEVGDAKIF